MKITHLIPALTKGGAERVVVELANEACRNGHEVTVLAASPVDPELLQDRLLPQVTVRFVTGAHVSRLRRYLMLPLWLARHRAWLGGQDVVHVHLTFAAVAGTLIQWLRRLSGAAKPKLVETYHAVGMPIAPWQRRLSAALAGGRDGYVLVAEDDFWRSFADARPRLPLAVIPNGIGGIDDCPTEQERLAYRQSAGIRPSGRFVVGTVGRIVAERNPLGLVAAFAEVARLVGPQVDFLMAGSGEMSEQVEAEAARLGLSGRLHLPGLIQRPAVALSVMDVYMSLNVGAVTGIAGLEAASFGLPVVALQTLPDHRLSDADWIWSSPDPLALGAEAARLLANEEERLAVADRQRRHVAAHHSSAAMAKAYEALYRRAGASAAQPS